MGKYEHLRIQISGIRHRQAVIEVLQSMGYREAWMNEDVCRIVTYCDGTYEGYAVALAQSCDVTLADLISKRTAGVKAAAEAKGIKGRSMVEADSLWVQVYGRGK